MKNTYWSVEEIAQLRAELDPSRFLPTWWRGRPAAGGADVIRVYALSTDERRLFPASNPSCIVSRATC